MKSEELPPDFLTPGARQRLPEVTAKGAPPMWQNAFRARVGRTDLWCYTDHDRERLHLATEGRGDLFSPMQAIELAGALLTFAMNVTPVDEMPSARRAAMRTFGKNILRAVG